VKSARGVFAAIVSVLIYDHEYNKNPSNDIHVINEHLNTDISKINIRNKNNIENNNLNFVKTEKNFLKISIDDPLKFSKLMKKEQELWNLAEIKNGTILRVWNELNKGEDRIENSIYKSFQDMKDDLSSGVPVEYVLGEANFLKLKFKVNGDVMIPRKSSETLVQSALELILNLEGKNIIDSIDNSDVYYDDKNDNNKVVNNYNNDIENKRESDNTHIGDIKDNYYSFSNDIKINNVDENKATYPLGVHKNKATYPLRVHENKATYPCRVLDIGVGSGCLLLSCINSIKLHNENLCSNNNNCNSNDSSNDDSNHDRNDSNASNNNSNKIDFTGVGIDISQKALDIAQTNAITLELENKVSFLRADFADLSYLLPGYSRDHGNTYHGYMCIFMVICVFTYVYL
jgi:methylase of polypeptide subunit release factors